MTTITTGERLGAAFTLERVFAAPRPLVFAAFTEPRHLARWWGPKEAVVVEQTMDLRPGGLYHYRMQGDGFALWGRFVWREITPPERIVFVNSFSDPEGGLTRHPMAPVWPLETLTTIGFDPVAEGTRVSVLWQPLNAKAEEQAAFDAGHDSMRQGWGGSLDRLETYLAEAGET